MGQWLLCVLRFLERQLSDLARNLMAEGSVSASVPESPL